MEVEQENPLERILRLAADEPAHRPEFCQVLLSSTVYILGRTSVNEKKNEATVTLEPGSKIDMQHWEKQDGTSVIPFFSSLAVLQNIIEVEQSYIALPARSLFEITLGANLVLNPKAAYGKEFTPEEVRSLLSDGIGQQSQQRTVQKETQVRIGVPANYPSKMVDSLTLLFTKNRTVKRAFLALMHDPSVDDKPHLIVGIEADGDIERIFREAGNVAADTVGEAIDLYRINKTDGGLSHYFLTEVKPFYERRWGDKLRSFFRSGTT